MDARQRLQEQLRTFFSDLNLLQDEFRLMLAHKQTVLLTPSVPELQRLNQQELEFSEKLEEMVRRRMDLLQQARDADLSVGTLTDLASLLQASDNDLQEVSQHLATKVQILLTQCNSQWVTCQKAFLHYSALVQIVANGGRKPLPTSRGEFHRTGGAVLDASI